MEFNRRRLKARKQEIRGLKMQMAMGKRYEIAAIMRLRMPFPIVNSN